MNTIKQAHQQAPNHNQKRQLLSLVSDSNSFNELKGMGFTINRRNYVVAKRHNQVYGPGQPVPKPKQPVNKRKMTEESEALLHGFLESNSHEAANRVFKSQPVRYVEGNVM